MALTDSKPEATTREESSSQATGSTDNAVEQNIHHPKGWWNWRVIMNLIVVGLALGLYGYDNNFLAPLLSLPLFILKYQGESEGFAFTARNLDLIITVPLVGAALGTFIAAPVMKKFGRKKAYLGAYFLLCTPGSFLQLFSPNLGALVVGRFWNYLGVSVLTTTAGIYLSELVPPYYRGRAIGFCVAGIAAVAIIATTIVWATEKIQDRRQYMIPLAIQAACPVFLGCLTFLCCETPMWYVQNNKIDEARRVLMALRNNRVEVVEAELAVHQVTVTTERENRKQVRIWDILHRKHLKRTLTSGALLSSSQVGGQILIGTYSTVILVQSGVGNPFQMTVVLTCLQFLGTIVGPWLVDAVGRRPVALVGFFILFILNMSAGGIAAAGLTTQSQRLGLAAVFFIFAFFNAASFQSLGFVLPAEIPTSTLREPSMAWSVFWSYTTAVITTFAVPQITAAGAGDLGAEAAFIFGGCIFVTFIWSYFYIPETRARTAVEIDEMYEAGIPMRQWRGYQCRGALANTTEKVQRNESMSA